MPDDPKPNPVDLDKIKITDLNSKVVLGADSDLEVGDQTEADAQTEEEFHLQEKHRLSRERFDQDTRARKEYANKIFLMVCVWLEVLWLVVIFNGVRQFSLQLWKWPVDFTLTISDRVLIALITGTTVNVLGLFAIVCNYLFPKRQINRRRRRVD
jgi:uncharacterized integral membrane protein